MEPSKSTTQYRAHIHLFPHSPSPQKSTTVPGEFPVTQVISRDSPKDFPRELVLTPEKPSQPIGRSSSNKNKGLFAARNNAFFDSPVMSRAHAEVTMLLEPVRKVIIKDSNSMHGTFVNGLQLAREETAELRDGTELTFGADVTRADELHPARTFRCAVSWEQKTEVPQKEIDTPKKLTGYGVFGDELVLSEMSGDEEEEYDEFDGDMDITSEDDEPSSSSSGAASSPPSSPIMDLCSKDEPVKADCAVVQVSTDTSKPEVICIDDEEPKLEAPRAKMPSIPSLVNRTQVQPSSSTSRAAAQNAPSDVEALPHTGNAAQPICIDEEEEGNGVEDSENDNEEHDRSYDSDTSMSEAEQSEDDEDDMDRDDTDELFEEHFDEMQDDGNGKAQEQEQEKVPEAAVTALKATQPKEAEPCSPPDVMSSKLRNLMWPEIGHLMNPNPYFARPITRAAPQSLPSIERYENIGGRPNNYAPWDSAARPYIPTSTHSSSQSLPHFMSQKKEFFQARSLNQSEAQRAQYQSENQQNMTSWTGSARVPFARPWCCPAASLSSDKINTDTAEYPHMPAGEDSVQEVEMTTSIEATAPPAADVVKTSEQTSSLHEHEGQEETSGVAANEQQQADAPTELPETILEFVNDDPELPVWPSGPKISIQDVVNPTFPEDNTASSAPEATGFSSLLASPPPSEKEVVHEEAPEATVICRKRKLERMVHVEVPTNGEDFQRDEYEDATAVSDRPPRPIKRARTARTDRGSTRVLGYAATFFGGLVVGGASIFAALVATAAE